ncbi:uncharacterized protein LOC128940400 [Melozone crissalis]|uniref:uncharacterized protein LOC128940400 n=1 Tax=Melozone crissalis TaxID=40204 RepID=UPI0023DC4CD6|nr:uncharacterized protein LOC128940400 [Melozone crissalis]
MAAVAVAVAVAVSGAAAGPADAAGTVGGRERNQIRFESQPGRGVTRPAHRASGPIGTRQTNDVTRPYMPRDPEVRAAGAALLRAPVAPNPRGNGTGWHKPPLPTFIPGAGGSVTAASRSRPAPPRHVRRAEPPPGPAPSPARAVTRGTRRAAPRALLPPPPPSWRRRRRQIRAEPAHRARSRLPPSPPHRPRRERPGSCGRSSTSSSSPRRPQVRKRAWERAG